MVIIQNQRLDKSLQATSISFIHDRCKINSRLWDLIVTKVTLGKLADYISPICSLLGIHAYCGKGLR